MDAIATTQKVLYVGGVATELCFMEFADRFMVVVTQLNKPGTLIRAQLEQGPDGVSAFGVTTLMGRRDDEMLEVFARRLIEDISSSATGAGKQLLLAIGLQQSGPERSGADFRELLQLVLDNKVW